MGIGKIIRELREEKGFSQEELAKSVGYKSRSTINKIELDINKPTLDKLIKMAKRLEVDPEILLVTPPSESTLQAWDAKFNPNDQLAEEVKVIEAVSTTYGKKAAQLMNDFNQLNNEGQDKVIEYTEDIVSIEQYQKKEEKNEK